MLCIAQDGKSSDQRKEAWGQPEGLAPSKRLCWPNMCLSQPSTADMDGLGQGQGLKVAPN